MRRPNHRVRHDLFAPWHGDRDSLVGACCNLQPKPSMKRRDIQHFLQALSIDHSSLVPCG